MPTPTKMTWTKKYADKSGERVRVELDAERRVLRITGYAGGMAELEFEDVEFVHECLDESLDIVQNDEV